ncbi:Processed lymphoid-restricted membrane protein [Thalictrum thalictroides]|uniref:Processed lymphoid-restricted membrane protein n=1 Tax=Thalictrum thalictroides TaxID=46969 RepID=A0A7J6WL43_THATH|nr:Processed lymphoid-restricted membrane protein [Thalictrum thalictroides]
MRVKRRSSKTDFSNKDNEYVYVKLITVPFLTEEKQKIEIPIVSEEGKGSSLFSSKGSSFVCQEEEMGKRGRRRSITTTQLVESPLKDQPQSSDLSSKKTKLDSNITTELTKLAGSESKVKKIKVAPRRRSQRIQNAVSFPQCQDMEPVLIESLELSGSEEEDRQCSSEEKKGTEAIFNPRTLEEKVDYAVLLLEEQGKTMKEFISKETNECFLTESPCMIDPELNLKNSNYKNMYMDSQKKIDELNKENLELRKKLETVLAELEGYKKVYVVFSEVIEKLKNTVLLSSLAKMNEIAFGASSGAPFGGSTALTTLADSPAAMKKPASRTQRKEKAAKVEMKERTSPRLQKN